MKRCGKLFCGYVGLVVWILYAFFASTDKWSSVGQKDCLEEATSVESIRRCFEDKPVNYRSPSQLYVWSCRESPWSTKKMHNLTFPPRFRNFFNATMTYRRDSEIDFSYMAQITRFRNNHAGKFFYFHEPNLDKLLRKKRYLALFVSAACDHTKGARQRYNDIMTMAQAGLDVHVYGKCFENAHKFPRFGSEKAVEIMSLYKFYFSYENSHGCRDYITEKFWENALYSGAVPVVLGPSKEDLEAQVPPNSFIFAADYSLEELMLLLVRLDKNNVEYEKYFEWRKKLKLIEKNVSGSEINSFYRKFLHSRTFGACDLCKSMHTGRSKTFRPIWSLEHFWYGSERAECLSGERRKHTEKSYKELMRRQVFGFPLKEIQPNHVTN